MVTRTDPRLASGLRIASWVALALAFGAPASAHQGSVRRALAVEPAGDVLHVLAHLEIVGKERREAMRLVADADHDGRLGDRERTQLETDLSRRALDGIRLVVGTTTVAIDGAKSALAFEAGLPSALMVHGTTPLPKSVDRIAVVTGRTGDPLTLLVRPGSRPVHATTRGKVEKGALKAQMSTLDRVSWRMIAGG